VYAGVPPWAVRVAEYALPAVAAGKLADVIVRGTAAGALTAIVSDTVAACGVASASLA